MKKEDNSCLVFELFALDLVPYSKPCVGHNITPKPAGLGGSVGCAVQLETRRSRVQPPSRSATFFRGD